MKPRLHRSVTFWSGILVMAFISWAWADSFRGGTWVRYGLWSATNSNGGVEVGFIDTPVPAPLATGLRTDYATRFSVVVLPAPQWTRGKDFELEDQTKARWFVEKLREITSYREYLAHRMSLWPESSWGLFLPHWLILLAVALPWSGLLYWRARRRRRAAGQGAVA
ncbi:hypothetical protein [Luteolibacter sp. Populi]|uniref:hypothetical protein n=1 Tax=Luteolibacter sp. Populi TaxID=3230487 RepID=UPI0034676CCC